MLTFKSGFAFAFVSVDEIVANTVVLAFVELRAGSKASGGTSGGNIVDAVAPVSELLGSRLAFANGVFDWLSVASVIVVTEALAVPLKTSVFVSCISASLEAHFTVIFIIGLSEFEVWQSVFHVTLWHVLPAALEFGLNFWSKGKHFW
jgi:hypothetical protein